MRLLRANVPMPVACERRDGEGGGGIERRGKETERQRERRERDRERRDREREREETEKITHLLVPTFKLLTKNFNRS